MTDINTVQELNNPVVETNPGQLIKERPISQSISTDLGPSIKQLRPTRYLADQTTLTWQSLAAQLRMISKVDWTVNTTVGLLVYAFELRIDRYIKYMVPLPPPAAHFDFDAVRFVFHKNTNPMFQGKLLIVYEPTPDRSYYEKLFDMKEITNNREYITQFQFVEFNTSDTDSMEIVIENFIPFNAFRYPKKSTTTNDMTKNVDRQIDYFSQYSMGRLIYFVFNKLATTSTKTSVPVNMMMQMQNLRYACRNF